MLFDNDVTKKFQPEHSDKSVNFFFYQFQGKKIREQTHLYFQYTAYLRLTEISPRDLELRIRHVIDLCDLHACKDLSEYHIK